MKYRLGRVCIVYVRTRVCRAAQIRRSLDFPTGSECGIIFTRRGT